MVIPDWFSRSNPSAARAMQFLFQTSAAWVLGMALGLILLVAGPVPALGALIGIVVFASAFAYPEIVILIMLFLAVGIVPAQFNPLIELPVGHFQATDLLLIVMLTIILARALVDKAFTFVRTPLDLPVFLFAASVILGVATAVQNHGINFKDTTPEARRLLYYLVFFAITQHIRTRPQLFRLIHGVLLIGLIAASMMLAQSVLGRSLLLVEQDALQGDQLIRFYYPAADTILITLLVMICSLGLIRDPRYKVVSILTLPVLGLSILLTLTRNALVSTVICLALLVLILREDRPSRLVGGLLAVALVVAIIVSVLGITGSESGVLRYSSTFLERISRMFSEVIFSKQENLAIRWVEVQYAWKQILQNPIFGIGMRVPYRPTFYQGDLLTDFIHNGYLWIWLKTGLLGLIPFLWISIRFLIRGFKLWRDSQDSFLMAATLGFTLAYLATLISNLVVASVASSTASVMFGAMMGMNEVVFTVMKRPSHPIQEVDEMSGEAQYRRLDQR